MSRGSRANDPDAPFQPLTAACRKTGLSVWFLRKGCKEGTIPHVMVGTEYRVNIPALLEQLDRESRAAAQAGAGPERGRGA